MRLLAIFFAAFLTAPALHAEAPLKRLTLRQDLLGWEAVGRVEIGREGYCTGVLIAPDLVLTAAHCLFADGDRYVQPSKIRFRAGLSDGAALAESGILRMVVHPDYDPHSPDRWDEVLHDVGLMQLSTPVPLTTAAPFATADLADGARDLSVVSYGRGRDEALSWDDRCNVIGRRQGLIAFDCDVTFGSSGAPVFHRMDNRAAIVSLVSAGGVTDKGQRLAFGMELPRAVVELKAALRRGEGVSADQDAPEDRAVTQRVGRLKMSAGMRSADGAKFLKP